nr:hypothetical protein CTI12_AA409240 [Tanacetum cinerariifolium]
MISIANVHIQSSFLHFSASPKPLSSITNVGRIFPPLATNTSIVMEDRVLVWVLLLSRWGKGCCSWERNSNLGEDLSLDIHDQPMFWVIADVFNWIDVVNVRQKARGVGKIIGAWQEASVVAVLVTSVTTGDIGWEQSSRKRKKRRHCERMCWDDLEIFVGFVLLSGGTYPSLFAADVRHRIAEVAGGTTAECAAVVCCFPCTVVNFLVLAVYKVPAGLCRKALRRKRRRRMMKQGLVIGVSSASSDCDADVTEERFVVNKMDVDEEFVELENEMWEKFYGTGFWRSLSQRIN